MPDLQNLKNSQELCIVSFFLNFSGNYFFKKLKLNQDKFLTKNFDFAKFNLKAEILVLDKFGLFKATQLVLSQ